MWRVYVGEQRDPLPAMYKLFMRSKDLKGLLVYASCFLMTALYPNEFGKIENVGKAGMKVLGSKLTNVRKPLL
jgi:hypothetical protein